jgi:hypothetical protein
MLFGDNQLNLGPFKQVAVNGHDRIRGSRYTPPDGDIHTTDLFSV